MNQDRTSLLRDGKSAIFVFVSSDAYGEPRQVGYRVTQSPDRKWSGLLYPLFMIQRVVQPSALLGQRWDTRTFYDRACDICGPASFRGEFVDLLDDVRRAGIRAGILSNELRAFS